MKLKQAVRCLAVGSVPAAVMAGVVNLSESSKIYFLDVDGKVQSTITATTIPEMDKKVTTIESDVTTLKSANTDKTNLLQSLNSKVATLEAANTAQAKTISDLSDRVDSNEDLIAELSQNVSAIDVTPEGTVLRNAALLDAIGEPMKVPVHYAEASSEYDKDRGTYAAMYAFDGDKNTDWASNNEGINFWITANFSDTYCISKFSMKNRATSFNTKTIEMTFGDDKKNPKQVFHLVDDSTVDNVFTMKPVCTNFIKLQATAVHKYFNNGAKEINFFGLRPMQGLTEIAEDTVQILQRKSNASNHMHSISTTYVEYLGVMITPKKVTSYFAITAHVKILYHSFLSLWMNDTQITKLNDPWNQGGKSSDGALCYTANNYEACTLYYEHNATDLLPRYYGIRAKRVSSNNVQTANNGHGMDSIVVEEVHRPYFAVKK